MSKRVLLLVALVGALASCASSNTTTASGPSYTPKVVGERLDVAKSDLKAAGMKEDAIEVVGGGTFGVVNESNWFVCEQRPGPGQELTESARVVVDRSCPSGTDVTAATSAVAAVAPTTVPTQAPDATASSGGVMPDVYCMNLQDAQDEIQRNGVFYSRSHDATGQERMQVLDRNWIVVGQSPPAGTHIDEGDAVLEVVKYGEPSPC